jgi:hypothetical protein
VQLVVPNTRGVQDARVELIGPDSVTRRFLSVSREGTFRTDSIPPGQYDLRVRHFGFDQARVKFYIGVERGADVLVALARGLEMLDGCGMTVQRVRKPWWKVW